MQPFYNEQQTMLATTVREFAADKLAPRADEPSDFCRNVIEKIGLDQVVQVFDNDDEAISSLLSG